MSENIPNYYQTLPAKYKGSSHNPGYVSHQIKIPARILICGPSGSFKTNLLMDILKKFKKTFETVVFCLRNKNQPFYEMIEDKMGDLVEFYDNEIPDMDDYEESTNKLIVFDDLLMSDKNVQKQIADYFVRGRHKKFTMIYLSQSFYKTDKIIRTNCNYIFLLKINSKRDLKLILQEIPISVDSADELLKIYEEARKGSETNFLNIDLELNQLKKNYTKVLK